LIVSLHLRTLTPRARLRNVSASALCRKPFAKIAFASHQKR